MPTHAAAEVPEEKGKEIPASVKDAETKKENKEKGHRIEGIVSHVTHDKLGLLGEVVTHAGHGKKGKERKPEKKDNVKEDASATEAHDVETPDHTAHGGPDVHTEEKHHTLMDSMKGVVNALERSIGLGGDVKPEKKEKVPAAIEPAEAHTAEDGEGEKKDEEETVAHEGRGHSKKSVENADAPSKAKEKGRKAADAVNVVSARSHVKSKKVLEGAQETGKTMPA